jgi:hypothetical protein
VRGNKHIVKIAVDQNWLAVRYASEEIKKDEAIMKEFL